MARQNRNEKLTRAQNRIAGLKKHFGAGEALWEGATRDSLVAQLKAHLDAVAELAAAEAARSEAAARAQIIERGLREVYRRLEGYVYATFGESLTDLEDFGMKPRGRPGPKKLKSKVAMIEKAQATRASRGTKKRSKRG